MHFVKVIYLLLILLICVYTDYKEKKIKNSCVLAIVIGAGFFLALNFSGQAVKCTVIQGLLSFAVLFPVYGIGALGAGDVKLLSAVFFYIGEERRMYFLAGTLLAGGILAVTKLMYYGILQKRLKCFYYYLKNFVTTGTAGSYPAAENETEIIRLALPIFAGGLYWGFGL